jgi:hypothetical protein
MSHIKNHTAYWNNAHKSLQNKQLNIDLEYFFKNPYSTEKKTFDLINHINYWGREFDYVINYEPYGNIIKSLPNVIIDHKNQKLILIPNLTSIDDSRTFSNSNYNEFKKFIEVNFNEIPSKEFLEFINNNRCRIVYVANNFNDVISKCEKKNSIKISINLIDYNINYTIVPKVTIVEAPKTYVVPVAPALVPVIPSNSNTTKKVYIAPALRPRIVEPPPKPIEVSKPKSNNALDSFGLSESLLNEFINEDCPKSKINMSAGGGSAVCNENPLPKVDEFIDDCPVPKVNIKSGGVNYETPAPKVTKTNFINFNDTKFQKLKDKIMNELGNNPSEEKLDWLNSLYDNIFIYSEFIDKVIKSEYLMFDQHEQKLIRKPFEVVRHKKYNLFNPEIEYE